MQTRVPKSIVFGTERAEKSLYKRKISRFISLGTRVLLAYLLAPVGMIGVWGIWWSIPVGWLLADLAGILFLKPITAKTAVKHSCRPE